MRRSVARGLRRLAARLDVPAAPPAVDRAGSFGFGIPPAVLVVGMGRSGTHFYAELARGEARLHAMHMDDHNVICDGFSCWAAWHRLPVDIAESIDARRRLAANAAAAGRIYFEANPLLGPWTRSLYEHLDTHVIVSVRKPEDVVRSHVHKRWFSEPVAYHNKELVPGYQSWGRRPLHGFSRIVPAGQDFETWCGLSPAGRVAWLWSAYYTRILDDIEAAGARAAVVRLETLDFERYERVAAWAGYESTHDMASFERVRSERPGRSQASSPKGGLPQHEIDEISHLTSAVLARCDDLAGSFLCE